MSNFARCGSGPVKYATVKFQAFCGPRQNLRPLRAAPLSCSPHGGLAGGAEGAPRVPRVRRRFAAQEIYVLETIGRCGFERLVVDGSVVHEYRCVSSAYLCMYSPVSASAGFSAVL